MRRATADAIEAKLRAKGLDVQRVFTGPNGYALICGSQTVATRKEAENVLRTMKAKKA